MKQKFLVCIIFLLLSCSNRFEIEEYSQVLSILFDLTKENEQMAMQVGFEIIDVHTKKSKLVIETGQSFSEILQKVERNLSKKISLSHCNQVFFSTRFCYEDIFIQSLHELNNTSELNLNASVLGFTQNMEILCKSEKSSSLGLFVTDYYQNFKDDCIFRNDLEKLMFQLFIFGDGMLPMCQTKQNEWSMKNAMLIRNRVCCGILLEAEVVNFLLLSGSVKKATIQLQREEGLFDVKLTGIDSRAHFFIKDQQASLRFDCRLTTELSNKSLETEKIHGLIRDALEKRFSNTVYRMQNDYDCDIFQTKFLIKKYANDEFENVYEKQGFQNLKCYINVIVN